MPSLLSAALVLAIFAVALLPTRRLFLAGWTPARLTAYLGLLVGLGVLVVLFRGAIRYLVPVLLVLAIVPFLTAPAGLTRFMTAIGRPRQERRPPPRDVTPRGLPPAGPPPEPPAASGPTDDRPEDGG